MKPQKKITLLSPDEMKIEQATTDNISLLDSGSGSASGSGTGGSGTGGSGTGGSGTEGLSEREKACVGKQFKDSCAWRANDNSIQNGICIYNKWGLTRGRLFCAKADYQSDTDKS